MKELGRNHIWTDDGKLLLESGGDLMTAFRQRDIFDIGNSLPIGIKSPDIYDIYLSALEICEDLQIRCPQLFLTDDARILNGMLGISYKNGHGSNYSNVFLANIDFSWILRVLSHELRHIWQHQKHEEKYFKDYWGADKLNEDRDRRILSYRLQPAEVDAEAYSVRYCIMNGLEKYPVERFNENDLNKAVEDRSKKMILPSKYTY